MSRHLAACAVLALLPACSSPRPVEKAPPPAKVANPVKESDFSAVTLTAEAEARAAERRAEAALGHGVGHVPDLANPNIARSEARP